MMVEFISPEPGNYTIKVKSGLSDKFLVTLIFMDNDNYDRLELPLYVAGTFSDISLIFDPMAENVLNVLETANIPHNFESSSIEGMTSLTWNLDDEICSGSFNVYSRNDYTPHFSLLTSVSGDVFDYSTIHPYQNPRQLYNVSCVDSVGVESILSETISNQARFTENYDLNGDNIYDLKDLITGLKVMSGLPISTIPYYKADIDGDSKIGLAEVLDILDQMSLD